MTKQQRIAIRPDGQRFLCDEEFTGIPPSWGKVIPGKGMGQDYYDADGTITDELFLEMPMPEFKPHHAEGYPKTIAGCLADFYAEKFMS